MRGMGTDAAPPPLRKQGARDAPIVLVDDNASLRGLIRDLLESAGYEVLDFGDGQEALDYLAVDGTTPLLVITDLVMQQMSGSELLAAVQRIDRCNAVPTLLMTGAARPDVDPSARVIHKPFDADALLRTIDELCHSP
jgi:CheY-like chemotaxis protein